MKNLIKLQIKLLLKNNKNSKNISKNKKRNHKEVKEKVQDPEIHQIDHKEKLFNFNLKIKINKLVKSLIL